MDKDKQNIKEKIEEISEETNEFDEVIVCDYCLKEVYTLEQLELHRNECEYKNKCYKCGRLGHNTLNCFAFANTKGGDKKLPLKKEKN